MHPLGVAVRRALLAAVISAVLGAGLATDAAAAQLYSIRDLGTLGGPVSQALSASASGKVVGTSDVADGSGYHAFLYTGGPLIDLGTFGGSRSSATAINASGQVVGFAWTAGDANAHAFLYQDGVMKDLGAFGVVGDFNSSALDINDAGQVVGWAVLPDRTAHAFLYSEGAMKDLGTLGGVFSQATAINASGQICGDSQTVGQSSWRAFLYSGGVMKSLGTLGGDESHAYDINDAGQVVGWSSTGPAAHAFLYSEGAMKDLGTLGGASSIANSINASGQVVGASNVAGSQGAHAFLWDEGKMRDLSAMVPAEAGWVLQDARHITDAGSIVGFGYLSGQIRPFLLTPIRVSALSLDRERVSGGQEVTATITLNQPAPSGGLVVPVVSSDPAVAEPVPPEVVIAAGATRANFRVTTHPFATARTVVLLASYGGVTQTATLVVGG